MEHASLAQQLRRPFHRRGVSGKDSGARPVARRDRQRGLLADDQLLRLPLGELDQQHAPQTADALGETAAGTDDQRRGLQGERAGDTGRGDLAHAVPEHRVRLDAKGAPERRQGDLQGKQ